MRAGRQREIRGAGPPAHARTDWVEEIVGQAGQPRGRRPKALAIGGLDHDGRHARTEGPRDALHHRPLGTRATRAHLRPEHAALLQRLGHLVVLHAGKVQEDQRPRTAVAAAAEPVVAVKRGTLHAADRRPLLHPPVLGLLLGGQLVGQAVGDDFRVVAGSRP